VDSSGGCSNELPISTKGREFLSFKRAVLHVVNYLVINMSLHV
jgi:hypothetical protein